MAKINNTQRLTIEQFPDQKDWIGKMFSVVNDFFQKVQSTINGSIEYATNIMGKEIEFDFLYGSATASLPLLYKWPLAKAPRSLNLVYSAVGVWGNDFDDTPSAMTVTTNKSLVPILALVCWEYTAEGNVSITDFAILDGDFVHIRRPVSGQRVVLRVRVEP